MLSAEGCRTRARRQRIRDNGWIELKRVVPRGAGVDLRALAEVLREAPASGAFLGTWILHEHLSSAQPSVALKEASRAELERRLDAGADVLIESALAKRMATVPFAAIEAAAAGREGVNPLLGSIISAFDRPHAYVHEALARVVRDLLTDQAHLLSVEAHQELRAAVRLPEDLRRAVRWAYAKAQPWQTWLGTTLGLGADDRPIYASAERALDRQLRASAQDGYEAVNLTVGGWDVPVLDAYADLIAQGSPAVDEVYDIVEEYYHWADGLWDEVEKLDLSDVIRRAFCLPSAASCSAIEVAPLIPSTGWKVTSQDTLDQVALGQIIVEVMTSSRMPWVSRKYHHARFVAAYLATIQADPSDREGFEPGGFVSPGATDLDAVAHQLVALYVSADTAAGLA